MQVEKSMGLIIMPAVSVTVGVFCGKLLYRFRHPQQELSSSQHSRVALIVEAVFIGAALSQIFSSTVREVLTLNKISTATSAAFYWSSSLVPPIAGVVGACAVIAITELI